MKGVLVGAKLGGPQVLCLSVWEEVGQKSGSIEVLFGGKEMRWACIDQA